MTRTRPASCWLCGLPCLRWFPGGLDSTWSVSCTSLSIPSTPENLSTRVIKLGLNTARLSVSASTLYMANTSHRYFCMYMANPFFKALSRNSQESDSCAALCRSNQAKTPTRSQGFARLHFLPGKPDKKVSADLHRASMDMVPAAGVRLLAFRKYSFFECATDTKLNLFFFFSNSAHLL